MGVNHPPPTDASSNKIDPKPNAIRTPTTNLSTNGPTPIFHHVTGPSIASVSTPSSSVTTSELSGNKQTGEHIGGSINTGSSSLPQPQLQHQPSRKSSTGLRPPPLPPSSTSSTPFSIQMNHGPGGGLRFAQDNPENTVPSTFEIIPWRMRERMKTMDVALVLCLNIGTDPPDVVKSSPCARKECWVDPFSMPAQKALETIGKTLQSQYERWQPRARYRQSLDPTVDEIKQLSVSLRRHAKHDRVLFHYNGHGVPRPTANGEIWVFNKSYTQYIPLLVYDLQSWLGTPAIYVFDCSAAGILLNHFNTKNTPNEEESIPNSFCSVSATVSSGGEAIVLAACAANEILPMNPELCADVFTSCLTTPITVALRWFINQNELSMAHLDACFIEKIPGKLTDRKTPLGELNWIFTAITDTIAWNVLPRELFQKLFRQDLLVASLFRNFLLAERIMKNAGCSPCSLPALPPTHHHPLWRSWDLAAEICLSQLYKISNPHPQMELSFQPSRFFAEQLTAFEVWLQFGSDTKPPPQQLPMVLQVLLSQVHRLRALVLLKKFLDLGPWAVNLALSVGIFPYVLRLLQSPVGELRQVLVFIWAKILALDSSCQIDLVKDEGHEYFIAHLASSIPSSTGGPTKGPTSVLSWDQKVMSAFILSSICSQQFVPGQKSCLSKYLHRICGSLLNDPHEEVRKWICLCLSKLWENYEEAKCIVIEEKIQRLLSQRLQEEPRPEVRCAAAYAIGTLIGLSHSPPILLREEQLYDSSEYLAAQEAMEQRAHADVVIATELLWGCSDASPLVRRESILALAHIVLHSYHQTKFEQVAKHFKNRSISKRSMYPATTTVGGASSASYRSTPISSCTNSTTDENMSGSTSRSRRSLNSANSGSQGGERRSTWINFDIPVDPELKETLGEDATYYAQIWHALKEIQSRDPYPKVVNAVKIIVSRVNTGVLASEQDHLRNNSQSTTMMGGTGTNLPPAHLSIAGLRMETDAPLPDLQNTSCVSSSPSTRGEPSLGGHLPPQQPPHLQHHQAGHGLLTPPQLQAQPSVGLGMRPAQSVGNFLQYAGVQQNVSSTSGYGPSGPSFGAQGQPLGSGPEGTAIGGHSQGYPSSKLPPGSGGIGGGIGKYGASSARNSRSEHNLLRGDSHGAGSGVGHGHESYRVNTSASAPRQEFPASLRSTFYEYCKAKFNEPILEPVNDDEDPLSEKGVAKRERSRRYERIQLAARKLMLPSVAAATASTGNASGSMLPMEASPPYSSFNRSAPGASSVHSRYIPPSGSTPNTLGSFGQAERDEMKRYSLNLRQCAVLNNEAEMTSLLLFHPYESLLVVADEKDQISVWNFEQSDKILTFGNKNPMGSRLTSLTWINENEESLLTCGSDDGVIKLYHGLHTSHLSASSCPKLLTAFVAVPDLVPGTRGSGLVTNWQQEAGMLYAGGNSSMVRGWNLRQERCTFGVPTHTDSCITSMASDETKGGILVAGFGDGSIRLFDSRSRPEYALKATMKEHSSWVVQTHVFTGRNELLSGSVSGELKFWDLRYAKTSIRTLEAHRSPMTALAVHDYAPIFASGSHNQFIKVFRGDGEQLALIRYHEGFLGERIGPVSCLAFHPHRLYLAAGATDSLIAIYSSEK